MKNSQLPDRTKMCTLILNKFPTLEHELRLTLITSSRGSENYMLRVPAKSNETTEEVEEKVHNAFVKSVCDLRNLPIECVTHYVKTNTFARRR